MLIEIRAQLPKLCNIQVLFFRLLKVFSVMGNNFILLLGCLFQILLFNEESVEAHGEDQNNRLPAFDLILLFCRTIRKQLY